MQILQSPSPNHDSRGSAPIDMLVLHYTGMQSGAAAIDRLCEAASKVSAHYVVEEDGRVFQLVEESQRAWHAGVSHWRGHNNINARSIGIEIVNPGHEWGYRPFPAVQMQSVIALSKEILARHPIPAHNVVAHSDVAFTRKEDPGELFDWAWLAREGVGIWPKINGHHPEMDHGLSPLRLQTDLAALGYGIATTGQMDAQTTQCITAFQRHFRPDRVNGQWDESCALRLAVLLEMVGE